MPWLQPTMKQKNPQGQHIDMPALRSLFCEYITRLKISSAKAELHFDDTLMKTGLYQVK